MHAAVRAQKHGFVVISRFEIANDMADEVKHAFTERPHLVDTSPGFCRMEVLSPVENPNEIWLMTWWDDEASFRSWHRSHAYRDAHRGVPHGLKLNPRRTRMQCFSHVAS